MAENSHALSIFWLRKYGYLHKDYNYRSGSITWTSSYGDKSSINLTVTRENQGTFYEKTYIQLNYTHTSSWSGEKSEMLFEVPLVSTPCNYGGKRYWFICPLTKNGKYCGRRVGVLFSIGKWFGCRHCGEVAYNSQMQGGRYKGFVSIPDVDRVKEEVKRYYYNGKPTRKYRRYMKMEDKWERNFMRAITRAGELVKKQK